MTRTRHAYPFRPMGIRRLKRLLGSMYPAFVNCVEIWRAPR